jgi:hypothetical protein
MPKNKKNNEIRAIKIFLPHHDHEPIKPLLCIQVTNYSYVGEYHRHTKISAGYLYSPKKQNTSGTYE